MNLLKLLSILTSVLLLAAVAITAQTPRRSSTQQTTRQAAPKPTPPPIPQPAASPRPRITKPPIPLATVNGQTITSADIDPAVKEEIDSLDDRIAEVREQVLQLQINTILLELEATKRRITPQQLFETEVIKKVSKPTEAEIKRFIAENREEFNEADTPSLHSQVEAFLRSQREAQLSEDLVRRLRAAYPVVPGARLETPNLGPSVMVATVGGRPITAGALTERLKPIIYRMKLETYLLQKESLDQTINNLLLLGEANRRNVPPESIVRTEVSDKIRRPTEAEVAKFFEDNRAQIGGDLATVRNQLAEYLVDQDQQRLENELAQRLRVGADVRLLISEPEQPVQQIRVDGSPSRGNANAPVTLVEFTDFECSSCAAMEPVLEGALKSYGDKVRLVIRNFPLARHPNAQKAAEAAAAAHAQGKFFEYKALLFKNQNALDVASLKKYASEVGLDRKRFDAALDAGTHAADVRRDLEDADIYGVDATPTIFVNGVMLRNLSSDGLRAAIDRALKPTK